MSKRRRSGAEQRSRVPQKPSPGRQRSAAQLIHRSSDPPSASDVAVEEPIETTQELLVTQWRNTRSGARAGRGFHFQDAVGAWLAAQIADGSISGKTLVPEGLNDMSLEGGRGRHVQVKSRVEHLGAFPVQLACRHILDAWEHHTERGTNAEDLTVVLERGIEGESEDCALDQCLDDSLSNDSSLRGALRAAATSRGLSLDEFNRFLSATSLVNIDWTTLNTETHQCIQNVADVPPSALSYIARELRIVVRI